MSSLNVACIYIGTPCTCIAGVSPSTLNLYNMLGNLVKCCHQIKYLTFRITHILADRLYHYPYHHLYNLSRFSGSMVYANPNLHNHMLCRTANLNLSICLVCESRYCINMLGGLLVYMHQINQRMEFFKVVWLRFIKTQLNTYMCNHHIKYPL